MVNQTPGQPIPPPPPSLRMTNVARLRGSFFSSIVPGLTPVYKCIFLKVKKNINLIFLYTYVFSSVFIFSTYSMVFFKASSEIMTPKDILCRQGRERDEFFLWQKTAFISVIFFNSNVQMRLLELQTSWIADLLNYRPLELQTFWIADLLNYRPLELQTSWIADPLNFRHA